MKLDIESQIRRLADAAFDETSPARPAMSSTDPDIAEHRTRGRWMLVAAASVLVIALVGALTIFGGSTDAPVAPVDSAAPGTTNESVVDEPPITVQLPTTLSVDSAPPSTTSESAVEELPITEQRPPTWPDFSSSFSAHGTLAAIPLPDFSQGPTGIIVEGTDLVAISSTKRVARDDDVDLPSPGSQWFDLAFLQDSDTTSSFLFHTARFQPDDFEQVLGFSFLDIDRIATASHRGMSDTFLALPIDVVALRSEVTALADEAGVDRIVDVGEGADGDPTPAGPTLIGVPIRLGVDEQRSMLSVSRSTPFVAAWLDAESPTLVEVADLATAATVLDRDDSLYSARFDMFDRDLANIGSSAIRQPESDFLIVEEFSTIAVGWSGVGEDQHATIVYVFADETAASASVEPIETLFAPDVDVQNRDLARLDENVTVGEIFVVEDVAAVGRTVVVSGRPGDVNGPGDIRKLFIGIGPLTVHR